MTYLDYANEYARDVLSGKVPACKWVKLAADRQLSDLGKWGKAKSSKPFWFDEQAAFRVCKFLETLPHTKGEWKSKNITLEPHQCFYNTTLYGWKRDDGYRRFRTSYKEVARKNAKTTELAGSGLYALGFDKENGAEVYSAATTRDQAKISWDIAAKMVRANPAKWKVAGIEAHAHSITHGPSGSFFKSLSADANSLDGLNIHKGGVDELHAHKTREVWEVLETATGSRKQSLLEAITTAGSNRAGICYEQRDYVTKILQGVIEDDTYFGIIYTLDDDDDWTNPELWIKPNPNLGVSVMVDDLARKCKKAMELASAQPGFLTKHCNIWVNADSAWMDMLRWDKCADKSLKISDFRGKTCWIGLDLSSKKDLAGKWYWFEMPDGKLACFQRYWCPEEAVEASRNSQYPGWASTINPSTGWEYIEKTDGAQIDYELIRESFEFDKQFQVRAVGYDPWQAAQLVQQLERMGLPMVEVQQSVKNLSDSMKHMEALVIDLKVVQDGNPCTAWQMSNVVCHTDAKDNVFPRKEREELKIDGPVAGMTALYTRLQGVGGPSVYQSRGALIM